MNYLIFDKVILVHYNYETTKMRTNLICLVILVLSVMVRVSDGKNGRTKFKRKIGDGVGNNLLDKGKVGSNATDGATGRGFFAHGGIFTLGKVLNFFPVGGERECQPAGHTVAKAGICLNPYDCRQRDGQASGDCAHGLGVCCVFEVSCGGVVQNNLTYFMSPGFPELWPGDKDCNITIHKSHAGISQLKIDFLHFTIGQPNRTTGECDEDAMILGEDNNTFTLCGQNHGQHIYYTLSSGSETREAGELPSMRSMQLRMRMRGTEMPRLWLMRLAQMPLAHSAPHNCLQYYTENNGTIKTFNYASNGRHLAAQEYKACVRRNVGFCSVRYSPCDQRSFRIGTNGDQLPVTSINLGSIGAGPVMGGGMMMPSQPLLMDQVAETQNATTPMPMMPSEPTVQEDEMEGSGGDPNMVTPIQTTSAAPSLASRIWRFMWPSWIWGQNGGRVTGRSWPEAGRIWSWNRWSPYAQHYKTPEDDKIRYYGYGNFGMGMFGFGRQRCQDRITIPCENEYFVSSSSYVPGVCDPHHCGDTFCPGVQFPNCQVETSISPFAVSVHFGPATLKGNPEDNIGACLRFTQLPCDA